MIVMNPMMQILSTLKGGGNPMGLLQQMSPRVPQVAQMLHMMQGKSPAEIEQMARNMCRERGVTPEQIANQLGISSLFGG